MKEELPAHAPNGIRAIVNNAGIGPGTWMELNQMKDFTSIMDVNFIGAVRVTKAFLPALKQGGAGGRVVNVSSTAELVPFNGMSAYAASKVHQPRFSSSFDKSPMKLSVVVRIVRVQ